MQIGFIGLGRMGLHMVKRLVRDHEVVAWNRSPGPREEAKKNGATIVEEADELPTRLAGRRIIWLMLPAGGITEQYFQKMLQHLAKDDILIDGANSNFHDTMRRHQEAKDKGISYLDVGVSGGIVAAERGYCMMVGGEKEVYEHIEPLLKTMCIEEGFGLMGPGGAGHYVKMIHNAIEYGVMQSMGEGFDLLENGRFKNLDLRQIAHVWNHGSIIASFLMEMAENAFLEDPHLDSLQPFIQDSGEGRWSAIEALEQKVPFTANTYALNARYISRDDNSMAFRMLAALRKQFGGHAIKNK